MTMINQSDDQDNLLDEYKNIEKVSVKKAMERVSGIEFFLMPARLRSCMA